MSARRNRFQPSSHLDQVSYEIRGVLDHRAQELERQGFDILKFNIGNPAAFGFNAPDSIRRAIIENLSSCSGYSPSKGIFPAREAVVMETQNKGIEGVTVDDVFMGNGVSELIMMTMEALLEPGDEVLIPSPDYPLWSAAVAINGAKSIYYPCRLENKFVPDADEVERLVTKNTRAIVLINPNNPSGAVYPKGVVQKLVKVAEKHDLIIFSDEIYDRITYDGNIHTPTAIYCNETLCATFGGLSKVYRAAGIRTGWVFFSGDKKSAGPYMKALELLASLRLCSNVPGQWAVQTALGGHQSINDLTAEDGRLGLQRRALIKAVKSSEFLSMAEPLGAIYGFIRVNRNKVKNFDDRKFAMKLLEEKHALIVPGSGFHMNDKDHFRVTFLPDPLIIDDLFRRIEDVLQSLVVKSPSKGNAA